jgi:hypothetical protein
VKSLAVCACVGAWIACVPAGDGDVRFTDDRNASIRSVAKEVA